MEKPFVVLLFGPTGVGKTDLLESLFSGRGEVVSADSMQVYRGMDIGTAKPSHDLRHKIPHHLIDIRDPREQYTAGDFVTSAESLIPEIASRGKIPIVSGGTAYYFRNLIFGLPETPPADTRVRGRLDAECSRLGTEEMYRRLEIVDPAAAARISSRDRYRVLRALEVFESSGSPLSAFPMPMRPRNDMTFLVLGLQREREDLYRRIEARVDRMFADGLSREFCGLHRLGLREGDPGMRGIGYREFFLQMRDGCMRPKDTADLVKADSRRYAKRQMVFFRSLPGVLWVHPDETGEIRRVLNDFLPCDFPPIG